jgi:hypothetical protein
VNVDYILMLVETYREERGDGSDREVQTLAKIRRAIDSSISLRNKRDLILAFVDSVTVGADIKEDWRRFVEARRGEELDEIIATDRSFVERAFRNGAIPHDRRGSYRDPPADLALRRRRQLRDRETERAWPTLRVLRAVLRPRVAETLPSARSRNEKDGCAEASLPFWLTPPRFLETGSYAANRRRVRSVRARPSSGRVPATELRKPCNEAKYAPKKLGGRSGSDPVWRPHSLDPQLLRDEVSLSQPPERGPMLRVRHILAAPDRRNVGVGQPGRPLQFGKRDPL